MLETSYLIKILKVNFLNLNVEFDRIVDDSTRTFLKHEKLYQIAKNLHDTNFEHNITEKKLKKIKEIIVFLVPAKNSILDEYLAILKVMTKSKKNTNSKSRDKSSKDLQIKPASKPSSIVEGIISAKKQDLNANSYFDHQKLGSSNPSNGVSNNLNMLKTMNNESTKDSLESKTQQNFFNDIKKNSQIDDDQLTNGSSRPFINPFNIISDSLNPKKSTNTDDFNPSVIKSSLKLVEKNLKKIGQDVLDSSSVCSFQFEKPLNSVKSKTKSSYTGNTGNSDKKSYYLDLRDKSDRASVSPATTCFHTDESSDNASHRYTGTITNSDNMSINSLNNNYRNFMNPSHLANVSHNIGIDSHLNARNNSINNPNYTNIINENANSTTANTSNKLKYIKTDVIQNLPPVEQSKLNKLLKNIYLKNQGLVNLTPSLDNQKIVFTNKALQDKEKLLSRKTNREKKVISEAEKDMKKAERFQNKLRMKEHEQNTKIQQTEVIQNKDNKAQNDTLVDESHVENNQANNTSPAEFKFKVPINPFQNHIPYNEDNVNSRDAGFDYFQSSYGNENKSVRDTSIFPSFCKNDDFNCFFKTPSPLSSKLKTFDFSNLSKKSLPDQEPLTDAQIIDDLSVRNAKTKNG